jgi:arylsulfatase
MLVARSGRTHRVGSRHSEKYGGYIGKRLFVQKLWAPTGTGHSIAAHLKSLMDFPPSQRADTLSMTKAIEEVMKEMESPKGGNN